MAEYSSKDIIAALKKSRKLLKTRELARKMKISQAGYKLFRSKVKEAIAEGKIEKGRGGEVLGVIAVHCIQWSLQLARPMGLAAKG